MKWLSGARRVFNRLLDGTVIVSAGILIFIMLSVSIDVLRRYLFNQSFVWVTQISEYGLVYITFLGAAWLLREEGHVYMETVVEMLGRKSQAFLSIVVSLIGIVVSFFFTLYGLLVTLDHLRRGVYEPTLLQLPLAPVLAVIPFGSLLLLVQFIFRAHDGLRLFKQEKDPGNPGQQ